jgi:hypothetical protein
MAGLILHHFQGEGPMKKYLLLGLVLIFANSFTSARAQSCSNYVGITNSSGSPPVVVGNAVQLEVSVPAGFVVSVYLDGNEVLTYSNPTTTPSIITTTLTVAYGNHTLQAGTCPAFDFSVVATPPPPGAPVLSGPTAIVHSGKPYTISWTVPSGSINHYTLSTSVNGETPLTSVVAASTTSESYTETSGPGTDTTFTYMVRACSSTDESGCGAWSNALSVDVLAHCLPSGCP